MIQVLGHSDTLTYEPWPEHNEAYLAEDAIKLPIQVRASACYVAASTGIVAFNDGTAAE